MRRRALAVAGTVATAGLLLSQAVTAHDTPNPDGHVPPNVNYGFDVIGRDTLAGVTDGLYTDVWSHDGYAYVGTFQEPTCSRAGVFVVDMAAAVANYAAGGDAGEFQGAVVAEIPSAPNTRVNDVKVHTITFQRQTRDVLILTEEKCGKIVGQPANQLGQGGISLYDVTDPSNPHALKQHFLDTEVHNTYAWTADDGRSYLIAVDDLNLNDVIIVDITKPQSPKVVGVTGIGDWIDPESPSFYPQIAADGQLFTGGFAAPLLHDVWVEKVGGQWQAVLSYWDAGFVTLDVTDPTSPEVLGDSTYPATDPVYGTSPAEGNAHAAVFGGDQGQYIWAGDEDFSPFQTTIKDLDGVPYNAIQGSDVPQVGPGNPAAGPGRYVGRACSSIPPASASDEVAVIERGDCAFTTKAGNAEAAGYQAAIVFNQSQRAASDGCETSISMLVSAGIPALFVPRSSGFALLGLGSSYDPSTCNNVDPDNGDPLLAGQEGLIQSYVDISADFDGWGYFHVLNNLPGGTTTARPPAFQGEPQQDRQEQFDAGYLDEIGYFAPAELLDPSLATGAGDLTMHNVEGDPDTAGDTPSFDAGPRSFISWYSAGMRAVEYRPGHWHTGNGDVYSWNVHEVGRFIADDGSNFWGVHVDELDGQQVILGSDRNTGLWIFSFTCESQVLDVDDNGQSFDTGLYCRR